LAATPWNLAEDDDINSWWTQWKDLFFGAVNDVIPQVKWKRHKMKSWLSASTIKLIRLKKLFYKKMKSNPECYIDKYKKLRNLVRNATRNYYSNHLESITNDLHRNQKPFVNKSKSCHSPIPALRSGSTVTSSDSAKAGIFNDYFVSVFTSEDNSDLRDLRAHLPNQPPFILDSIIISESEVVEASSSGGIEEFRCA